MGKEIDFDFDLDFDDDDNNGSDTDEPIFDDDIVEEPEDEDDGDDFFDFDDKPVKKRAAKTRKTSSQKSDSKNGKQKTGKSLGKKIGIGVGAFFSALVLLITGIIMGASINSSSTQAPKATAIEKKAPVLEQLETLKDSQLKALQKELAGFKANGANIDKDFYAMFAATQQKHTGLIDDFLTDVMNISPTATEDELKVVRDGLKNKMSKNAGTTTIYDVTSGKSAAKDLDVKGKRSAASTISPVLFTDKMQIYTVITPFTTEKKTFLQLSVIKIVDDKIDNYQYVGLLDDEVDSTNYAAVINKFITTANDSKASSDADKANKAK